MASASLATRKPESVAVVQFAGEYLVAHMEGNGEGKFITERPSKDRGVAEAAAQAFASQRGLPYNPKLLGPRYPVWENGRVIHLSFVAVGEVTNPRELSRYFPVVVVRKGINLINSYRPFITRAGATESARKIAEEYGATFLPVLYSCENEIRPLSGRSSPGSESDLSTHD
ncbi:MAG TPA: hypothetical protein VLF94_07925 [Chlamydiales bacterium]|nr:hypothetical protein [Chlamydiales bacterium]